MPAAKGNQYAKGNKGGCKSDFKKAYCIQAYKLTLLGATDADMADFFGVTEKTINNWKRKHEEFLQSIKKGKMVADAKVAEKLYNRAVGYSYKEVSYEKVDLKEAIKKEPDSAIIKDIYKKKVTVKELAPDTTAQIFWLKNRQPKQWRDKQDHEITGKDGGPIETTISEEEFAERLRKAKALLDDK